MAHYAKVTDGIVTNVIVAEEDFFDSYVDNTPGHWIQTSYNTYGGVHYVRNDDGSLGDLSEDQTKALRKNYATIGHNYDKVRDAFYAKQPYPSWTLNEDTCFWEAPVDYPDDYGQPGIDYIWNEEDQQWDLREE